MDKVKQDENVLIIWKACKPDVMQDFVSQIQKVKGISVVLENSEMFTESSRPLSSFNVAFSNWLEPHSVNHTDNLLALISKVLKPSGRLYLHDESDLTSNLKLNGFVNIVKEGNTYIAEKPSFEVGSRAPLKIGQKNVWKLDETVEAAWNAAGDDEIIDADELLDEKDLVKPDKESLRVCSTTGKRRACVDCTCGLSEELSGAKGTTNSSCGSCYLGDAFRCASCPYLGMPAFKPGDQVKLDLDSDM